MVPADDHRYRSCGEHLPHGRLYRGVGANGIRRRDGRVPKSTTRSSDIASTPVSSRGPGGSRELMARGEARPWAVRDQVVGGGANDGHVHTV